MDIVQEHVVRARSSGGVFAKAAVLPPWGIALPGSIQLIVHMVLKGRAYLWTDDHSNAQELVPERTSDHQSIDRLCPSKPYELLTVCSLVKQYPMEVKPQLLRIRRQMTALLLRVLARYPLALLYTI